MRKLILFLALLATTLLWGQQPKLVLPIGHTAMITSASFSPDGKKIITASEDGTAKLWNAFTGELLADMKDHGSPVTFAKFSPDGKNIITSDTGTIIIWDALTAQSTIRLNEHVAFMDDDIFSPDGRKIIVESDEKLAKVWNVATGELLLTLNGNEGKIVSAQFIPGTQKIMTSYWNNTAKIWDANTGQLLTNQNGVDGNLYAPHFSPDGQTMVTGGFENSQVWDFSKAEFLHYLNPGTTSGEFVEFSPDGKKILVRSLDDFKILDKVTGNILVTFPEKADYLHFSPDGKKLVSCLNTPLFSSTIIDFDTIKIWDALTGKLMMAMENPDNERVNDPAFSPDGQKIITNSYSSAIVWNITTGKLLLAFKGYANNSGARFSHYDTKIITDFNHTIKFWDALRGMPVSSLKVDDSIPYYTISTDEKNLITSSGNTTGKILDIKTGKVLVDLLGYQGVLKDPMFSPDGKFLLASCEDTTTKIWDAEKGVLLKQFKTYPNIIFSSVFSPDGKKIAREIQYSPIEILDTAGNRLKYFVGDGKGEYLSGVHFSPDGQNVIAATDSGTIEIWDIEKSSLIMNLQGHNGEIWTVEYSPDGKKIVTASVDNTARIWEAATGKLLFDLKGHTGIVSNAQFSPDGKRIITNSNDQTSKVWDVASGQLLYTFITIDSADYLIQLPSSEYLSTPNAAKRIHYVTPDLKVISFEQLDVKYNRPDLVLQALGNTDTALIKSYRKAWEKRIKKLGIDTMAFRDGYSVPEADFTNRDDIEFEQKNEKLTLHIKGVDSTYKLDRFNVWVNESPIYGQRGISIRKTNSSNVDTIITIKLSQGQNRIETSITNINGTESYRMPLTVNYTPAARQQEKTRFIGIGIDQFADNQYNLQYSVKDIRDLSIKLKEKYGNDISIDTLFNRNVTVSNVKGLKEKLWQTTENDKVIIAYSGHGMLSKDYDYYLSTYAVNFEKPEQNGLPYDELENLLDSIPARKKLMLIDACHSGEVDKEDLVTLNAGSGSLIKGLKPVGYKQEGHLGLKNSFELMQTLFVNVGKNTGATVISAAAGTQFALERNDLKNGVFTFSILEAMGKYPAMKISDLKRIVGERVWELTNGLQQPTSRNEMITVDWNAW